MYSIKTNVTLGDHRIHRFRVWADSRTEKNVYMARSGSENVNAESVHAGSEVSTKITESVKRTHALLQLIPSVSGKECLLWAGQTLVPIG